MEKLTVDMKIKALRELMAGRGIDLYIVPTADYHQSEIPGSYFKARKYMTGFTGSEGTLVVTQDDAALWVDGRYFIQAGMELEGTCIRKMEMGEPGVPTIIEYIDQKLTLGGVAGFDGRVMNTRTADRIFDIVVEKNGNLYFDEDLVDYIWEDRPPMARSEGWLLSDEYSGEASGVKIERLKEYLATQNCDSALITRLDDIAWLTNMRGDDVRRIPLILSFMIITEGKGYLFVDYERLTDELKDDLRANGIVIKPYENIYDFMTGVKSDRMLMDLSGVNYMLYHSIPIQTEIVDEGFPLDVWKAVKNPVQMEHVRRVHVGDGVAQTKLIYWLKKNVEKKEISEIDVAKQLYLYRSQQEGFLSESFKTIAAYGENGAIVHYTPSCEHYSMVEPKGMLLLDSGGQYMGGTTDATRTIVLGPITEEEKHDYTMVLRSHIRLVMSPFLYGCTGRNLDVLARGVMWEEGKDYKHGTGHGIGYMSNVHEGANAFRWKQYPGLPEVVLEEGMVTSDEPGYYREGHYGIRIENATMTVKGEKNQFGQFMHLETLTLVPYDRAAIDVSMMEKSELRWLNKYHAEVFEKLSPFLTEEEREWLAGETAPFEI